MDGIANARSDNASILSSPPLVFLISVLHETHFISYFLSLLSVLQVPKCDAQVRISSGLPVTSKFASHQNMAQVEWPVFSVFVCRFQPAPCHPSPIQVPYLASS
jgi:hypothetical protein